MDNQYKRFNNSININNNPINKKQQFMENKIISDTNKLINEKLNNRTLDNNKKLDNKKTELRNITIGVNRYGNFIKK